MILEASFTLIYDVRRTCITYDDHYMFTVQATAYVATHAVTKRRKVGHLAAALEAKEDTPIFSDLVSGDVKPEANVVKRFRGLFRF